MDSSDIFALQDEISEAIVRALKLRLLPEEKKAIERRGTENAEAHNLYLMARQTLGALAMRPTPRHQKRLFGCRPELAKSIRTMPRLGL